MPDAPSVSSTPSIRSGALVFDGASDHDAVDRIVMTAQNVILDVLELQKTHFELAELHEPLQQCCEDFLFIWKKERST